MERVSERGKGTHRNAWFPYGSPELLMRDELIELATREEERIH
jgi:hypothetical protein